MHGAYRKGQNAISLTGSRAVAFVCWVLLVAGCKLGFIG
jgi:hypothetical protein